MDQDRTLTVHDLLRAVSRKLGRKHGRGGLRFPDGVCSEIADDSDGHRTRTGYMRYRSARIVRIGGKRWVLARGERWGQYPADAYDSDIVAIRIADRGRVTAKLAAEVAQAIREGSYFRHSLVVGLADGNLALYERSGFSAEILPRLRSAVPGLIARAAQRDGRYLSLSTLQPIVTSAVRYKPEAIRALADIIRQVLAGS